MTPLSVHFKSCVSEISSPVAWQRKLFTFSEKEHVVHLPHVLNPTLVRLGLLFVWLTGYNLALHKMSLMFLLRLYAIWTPPLKTRPKYGSVLSSCQNVFGLFWRLKAAADQRS